MLRTIEKTVGSALAVLRLVSTFVMATERTCTVSDGKGNRTAAIGSDGKEVVVVGQGGQVGEHVICVDKHCSIF